MKKWVTLGLVIGSIIGGYIPAIWAAGVFSAWAIITSTIGGIIGIWTGVKVSQYFDI